MMTTDAGRRDAPQLATLSGAVHLDETVMISAPPAVVFAWIDDPQNTGWHMSRSSVAMLGAVLHTEQVSSNQSGLDATYRSHGRILGLPVDFTARVTRWVPDREKIWRTIGEPRLIVLGAFEMQLTIAPEAGGCRLAAGIDYTLPKSWAGRLLAICWRVPTAAGVFAASAAMPRPRWRKGDARPR
jgi:hypothetical protein